LTNFEQFEAQQLREGSQQLHGLRRAAIDRFAELGFPTTFDEEWRFTSVAPLAKIPFKLAGEEDGAGLTAAQLGRAAFPIGAGHRLVFVNGHFARALSTLGSLPKGVFVGSLAQVLAQHPEWVTPHLALYAKCQDHAFTALNTAFIQDGAFV